MSQVEDRTEVPGDPEDSSSVPKRPKPMGPFAPKRPKPQRVTDREYSDVVYVFEPNRKEMPPLREYLEGLWVRRKFMTAMSSAEVRGGRSAMVLGELWGIIDPIFQAALYWFLLSIIRGKQSGPGATDWSSRMVLMVGCIFLFNFISVCIGDGGRSILKAKSLMLNSTFPRGLLPLSSVYRALTEFIPAVVIYVIFHVAFGQPVGIGMAAMPFLFAVELAMAIGMAFMFAAFTVFLRDTSNIINYSMRVFFFATPVIYPVSSLGGGLGTILRIVNPFFALFAAFQACLTGGTPSPVDMLIAVAWATFFLVAGYRIFVTNERSFALRL